MTSTDQLRKTSRIRRLDRQSPKCLVLLVFALLAGTAAACGTASEEAEGLGQNGLSTTAPPAVNGAPVTVALDNSSEEVGGPPESSGDLRVNEGSSEGAQAEAAPCEDGNEFAPDVADAPVATQLSELGTWQAGSDFFSAVSQAEKAWSAEELADSADAIVLGRIGAECSRDVANPDADAVVDMPDEISIPGFTVRIDEVLRARGDLTELVAEGGDIVVEPMASPEHHVAGTSVLLYLRDKEVSPTRFRPISSQAVQLLGPAGELLLPHTEPSDPVRQDLAGIDFADHLEALRR